MEGEEAWKVMRAQRRVMRAQTQTHALVSEARMEHARDALPDCADGMHATGRM
jgi:hypothetical protein